MSFDIHLQCFERGECSKFPRHIAWEKFAPYAKGSHGEYEVRFPDGSGGYLSLDEEDEIDGFSFNRPCPGMLYEVIFEIMLQTPTLLYWNDGSAIANASYIPGIPIWLRNALGIPLAGC